MQSARIEKLEKFEAWSNPKHIDYLAIVPIEQWNNYWELLREIKQKMYLAQVEAEKIRILVHEQLKQDGAAS